MTKRIAVWDSINDSRAESRRLYQRERERELISRVRTFQSFPIFSFPSFFPRRTRFSNAIQRGRVDIHIRACRSRIFNEPHIPAASTPFAAGLMTGSHPLSISAIKPDYIRAKAREKRSWKLYMLLRNVILKESPVV